jgi:hypothetical protein
MNDIAPKIFRSIEKELYVIIKYSTIENMTKDGCDIDLLCENIDDIIDLVILNCKEWSNSKNNQIDFKRINSLHAHIDFIQRGKLKFRLDLYQDFPKLNKIILRNSFRDFFLKTRLEKNYKDQFKFYTPNKVYESIIRYIEYVELFDKRNDKIKHLDYILNNNQDKKAFSENLHFFIKFPPPSISKKRKFNIKDFNELIEKIKQTPFKKIIPKTIKFIKNANR